jgi:hypothetical protein
MQKALIVILVVVVLVLVGYWGYGLYSAKNKVPLVGGDKDSHNCIGSAGYSWCEAKSKCLRVFEEFCPDAVATMVADIKNGTGMELTKVGDTEFVWNVEEDRNFAGEKILGLLYKNTNTKMTDYLKIEKLMSEKYTTDINNAADGVSGGLRGFTSGYMACLLGFNHNEIREYPNAPSEPVGDSLTVNLRCGYFNPNNVSKIVATQYIKSALATKYKKDINQVQVNVTKLENGFAVGGVYFGPVGTTGGGGMFLAMKKDGKWQVVFDGNGAVNCVEVKTRYNFPQEMLTGLCD